MALTILLGVLSAAIAVCPMYAGLRVSERMDAQRSASGYLTPVLLAVGGSIVILTIATFICMTAARESLLVFTFAESCTLVMAGLGFGTARALHK